VIDAGGERLASQVLAREVRRGRLRGRLVAATASATCWVPTRVPGGNPVTDVPGLSPRSPVMTEAPVFVIVLPARTAKPAAVPRLGALAANAGLGAPIVSVPVARRDAIIASAGDLRTN
jgi:hypothetical protein